VKQITRTAVLAALRSVHDPELGVNVVDLGLVYSVQADGGNVRVAMTMTTPVCPLHSYIRETAEDAIRSQFPTAAEVTIEIVWEPKWHPMMMSDEARRQLGWQQ
jgi:metal-sulfur cluster biosynthetic enzyme